MIYFLSPVLSCSMLWWSKPLLTILSSDLILIFGRWKCSGKMTQFLSHAGEMCPGINNHSLGFFLVYLSTASVSGLLRLMSSGSLSVAISFAVTDTKLVPSQLKFWPMLIISFFLFEHKHS